ncbi:hypothetical protein JX265_009064 [Neoarthrinium moseri]|uniref:Signal peptide-containing protein n=1 Tax=Neoarthrinium moseri TaxID=1658444 RepID=A0A9Q0ALR0_9PEZI|nr:uncharacterized protein JN550_011449 [Neoarthrinium moseri]KAI1846633.1 hypothetical protein JX266_007206 [Neoarthrinium moseri]KAI1860601.1 hypothetical protein JN550_011449 [Neoarthrinium moseri]KAI1863018.1 hypothetical protein JX265_009064 [Neoarthrinium moseri]
MSFAVAVQSAIFYICACTPCAQAREHRQSKKKAEKAREEKIRIQNENPHLYKQPDPFNTNPYWSEEIMMGPSLPRKKSGPASKNTSQRALNSAGRESRSTTASSIAVGTVHIGSSPTVVPEDAESSFSTDMSKTYSDDWNKKRYQREDEELWGREFSLAGHRLMDVIKQAGSSAGRMLEATLGKDPRPVTEEDRTNFYSPVKNPPVNEYHPPIVSQRPKNKDAAKWMLQPPPPAKVMEGKVPVSRSTSLASQASRRTMASDGPALGRQVQEKMLSAKLRSGEAPMEGDLAASVRRVSYRRRNTSSSRGGRSQRSTRSRSLSLESSDASDEIKKQQRRRPRARPPITPEVDSSEDEDYLRGSIDSLGIMTKAARRPKLQTIRGSQASSVKEGESRDKLPEKPDTQAAQPQPSPLRDISNISPQSKLQPTTPNKVLSTMSSTPTLPSPA